ncbi:MAG: hypothetical protein WD021_05065 [Rhodothermales bacterium]
MSDREQERKENYQRVRSDFDELNSEEKVVFLLEATVTTLARGIDAFGRAVSDELNNAFSKRAEKKSREENADGAAPETEKAPSNVHASTGGTDTSAADASDDDAPSDSASDPSADADEKP